MIESLFFSQWLLLAMAHGVAVASPGPDLAIVIKQSIELGKRHAILTSIGIGCAILIHVLYSALGIGLLITNLPMLFEVLKYLCASYLLFIGYQSLRTKSRRIAGACHHQPTTQQTDLQSFRMGFVTNVLNPKATLFFLSIFSVVVTQQTPVLWFAVYGVYLSGATMAWFCAISLVLSHEVVREKFLAMGHYFNWLMGIILIALALKLIVD